MAESTAPAGWAFGEATVLRAAAFTHLALLAFGLVSPVTIFAPWGIALGEPATFFRFAIIAQGTLGFALLRAAKAPRRDGRLLVETAALVDLAFFFVLLADSWARKLPPRAPIAGVVDLVFGVMLFRMGRRDAGGRST